MGADSAFIVVANRIDHVDQARDLHVDAGFLEHLATAGRRDGLADLLGTARDAPGALERRLGPLDQQHFVAAPDDDPDAHDRTRRILAGPGREILGDGRDGRTRHAMYCPPFTVIVDPVTNIASSATRNSTACAISRGLPNRPTGIRD